MTFKVPDDPIFSLEDENTKFLSVIAVGENRLRFYRVPTPVLLPDDKKQKQVHEPQNGPHIWKSPRTTNKRRQQKQWNDYMTKWWWKTEKIQQTIYSRIILFIIHGWWSSDVIESIFQIVSAVKNELDSAMFTFYYQHSMNGVIRCPEFLISTVLEFRYSTFQFNWLIIVIYLGLGENKLPF